MNALILGIYGLFFISAGFSGNATEIGSKLKDDFGGFVPWAIAIAVLAVLAENDSTEGLVKPFAFLFILNFILRNWDTISAESKAIFNMTGVTQ